MIYRFAMNYWKICRFLLLLLSVTKCRIVQVTLICIFYALRLLRTLLGNCGTLFIAMQYLWPLTLLPRVQFVWLFNCILDRYFKFWHAGIRNTPIGKLIISADRRESWALTNQELLSLLSSSSSFSLRLLLIFLIEPCCKQNMYLRRKKKLCRIWYSLTVTVLNWADIRPLINRPLSLKLSFWN